MAKLNLNLSEVKEQSSSGYSFVPAGKYTMKVVKTDVKENSNKTGHILCVDLEVQDFGDHVSKKVPYNMNIVHTNAETQRIALSQLKTLAIAVGAKNPNAIGDSDELITGAEIEVEITEREYNGKNYSNVHSVSKKQGSTPAQTTAAAPAKSQDLPWLKK